MSVITIVGAGMMGSAIGIPAAHNGNEVRLVGTPLDREIIDHARATGEHLTMKRRLPESYKYYQFEQMQEALEDADLMVGGVSSFGVDWFCENVLKVVDPELPILTVTKGMQDDEEGNLHVYPEIFEAKSGSRGLKLNAVGGPCTSYELADLDYTEVTFCGKDMELLRKIRAMFETDYYHVSISNDVIGVEAAVAMKNAYALGVTLAVGMAVSVLCRRSLTAILGAYLAVFALGIGAWGLAKHGPLAAHYTQMMLRMLPDMGTAAVLRGMPVPVFFCPAVGLVTLLAHQTGILHNTMENTLRLYHIYYAAKAAGFGAVSAVCLLCSLLSTAVLTALAIAVLHLQADGLPIRKG